MVNKVAYSLTHKHTHTHTTSVARADILQLVQLVFTVMTSAMQDDPANKKFFENNVSVNYSHQFLIHYSGLHQWEKVQQILAQNDVNV